MRRETVAWVSWKRQAISLRLALMRGMNGLRLMVCRRLEESDMRRRWLVGLGLVLTVSLSVAGSPGLAVQGERSSGVTLEAAVALARAGACGDAEDMFRQLAEAGVGEAAVWMGVLHREACGRHRDLEMALYWYGVGARLGDVAGFAGMGMCHADRGEYEKAESAFRAAAERGHARSQYNLGTMYDRGWGVPKSAELKLRWWRRAALGGDGFAQKYLGVMYANGEVVDRNLVTGYGWIALAVDQQVPEAVRLLETLAGKMSAQEVQRGRVLHRELAVRVAAVAGRQ